MLDAACACMAAAGAAAECCCNNMGSNCLQESSCQSPKSIHNILTPRYFTSCFVAAAAAAVLPRLQELLLLCCLRLLPVTQQPAPACLCWLLLVTAHPAGPCLLLCLLMQQAAQCGGATSIAATKPGEARHETDEDGNSRAEAGV